MQVEQHRRVARYSQSDPDSPPVNYQQTMHSMNHIRQGSALCTCTTYNSQEQYHPSTLNPTVLTIHKSACDGATLPGSRQAQIIFCISLKNQGRRDCTAMNLFKQSRSVKVSEACKNHVCTCCLLQLIVIDLITDGR